MTTEPKADFKPQKTDSKSTSSQKIANLNFERQLHNQMSNQANSIDAFLQSQSFFSRSHEEINLIYSALTNPESQHGYLDSLGLTDVDTLYKRQLNTERSHKSQKKF